METVVEVVENAEAKFEDSIVAKTSSAPKSLKLIADPVVYQLVRVEGDGRLVPATDDEVMEVEDLLEDGKSETHFIADIGGTVESTPINKCSSEKTHLKGSEGLLQSENLEVDSEKSSAVLDPGVNLMKSNSQAEEIVPSLAPTTNDSRIHESGGGQCSTPQGGLTESGSLTSSVCSSWKPDFSKLRGEICLDNLSVRELHETFRATFGRETSVKDKQWLKRRIAMGLTNSCDVSTTTFFIEDNRVVKKGKEGSKIVDGKDTKEPVVGVMDENCGGSSSRQKKQMENHVNSSCKRLCNPSMEYNDDSKDTCMEQRAVKRVRKPTRRYIEEVSEGEYRENSGKFTSQVKHSGHAGHGQSSPRTCVQPIQNVRPDGKPLVTRQDSLGGSGIQIPYVSRVRRGRPRENFMALMELQPSGMGIASNAVKKAFGVYDSQPDTERGNKVVKARLAPGWVQQPLITKPEKAEECLQGKATEFDKDEVLLQHMDSSGDNSYDNIATVPTANGGMRRKHHRPWTLSEVVKLVEGVARYGAGRWSEIKRVSFASYSYRTSVDLKDKWRNLLRASFAQLPADKGVDNSRKHSSFPIPASVLVRVRELAEMQAQVPPNLSVGKVTGHSGRSVHETRSGYL